MEIIVETSTAWSSRRLYKFYKNKKFIKDFVEAFSTDDEVTRFIYANAFYLRVKYEGKPISEKIPMGEITEIIMSEFNEFMDCASDSIKFSPDPEDIFNFIACDGIYNEMDAVLSLRDELACSLDGLSGMLQVQSCNSPRKKISGLQGLDNVQHRRIEFHWRVYVSSGNN